MIRTSFASNRIGRNFSFITFLDNNRIIDEQSFVGCAAYMRNQLGGNEILIQAPLEWHERYGNVEQLKRWEKHINLVGGEATFCGTGPYRGNNLQYNDFVTDFNLRNLKLGYRTPIADMGANITKNEWVYWKIPTNLSVPKRYFTFCLIRYLYSRHLSPIVDMYYEIRKVLPKVQCFKVLQLAHHGYNPKDPESMGASAYNATWTVFDPQIRSLVDKEEGFRELNSPWNRTIQGMLAGKLYQGKESIKLLLLNGEYKKAYDELNR